MVSRYRRYPSRRYNYYASDSLDLGSLSGSLVVALDVRVRAVHVQVSQGLYALREEGPASHRGRGAPGDACHSQIQMSAVFAPNEVD